MSSLLTRFSAAFDPTIESRGRVYFRSGRVHAVSELDDTLTARVRGSSDYKVGLARDGALLAVSCDCPYLTTNLVPCKHVVATILLAEARAASVVSGRIDYVEVDERDDDEDDEDDDDDEYEDDDYDEDEYEDDDAPAEPPPSLHVRPATADPDWKRQLALVARAAAVGEREARDSAAEDAELVYVVDAPSSTGGLVALEVAHRKRKSDGEWGAPKPRRFSVSAIAGMPDHADREILAVLAGGTPESSFLYGGASSYDTASRYRLGASLASSLVPKLAATGRLFLRDAAGELSRLAWDDGPAWAFALDVERRAKGTHIVSGALVRNGSRRPLSEPPAVAGSLVFDHDRVAPLDNRGAGAWAGALRAGKPLSVPAADLDDFVATAAGIPGALAALPPTLRLPEALVTPAPRLAVRAPQRQTFRSERLVATLAFDYAGTRVEEGVEGRTLFDRSRRRLVVRDPDAERAASDTLFRLGVAWDGAPTTPRRRALAPKRLPGVARELLAAGWTVEAEGKPYRRPGEIRVDVSSGVDWFDLRGTVDYGGASATLPDLLAAARMGEQFVRLDDGSLGVLPEEWLRAYGGVASFGRAEGDAVRFRRSQLGLLDALLAAQPEARVDRAFAKARDELRRFAGVEAADPPPTFEGELRPYQREGLGWTAFLRRFGFGGILADDMGLGKTVQVLALLEERRVRRRPRAERARPSLVVVPRSLVFNWKLEAARFAPLLRVLDHTGPTRAATAEALAGTDVVLTTYGTLRRDAALLAEVDFDYAILDEAQAIKNPSTDAAKAARLVRAEHRLAMSGTPVENHLGELWSLFEFLNPGFLGSARAFAAIGGRERNVAPETRDAIAAAIRPFVLRRTKEQVAKDLPAKTEQTLYCDLSTAERKLYDQLAAHYRGSLLDRVARDGIKKSKIHVLEALLRLRQAACHTGLVDPKRADGPSAKVDLLLDQLREVVGEGHKALVFSQFTSLLAIVRGRLEAEGVVYEYLDGATRDRAARVERFQTDPDCPLFLISLKAGGLGLNLTAAEYVYLLDPWWNPAVEAQAVDRAHRIGQTRNVFAYRIIARGTVEEKVLELQASKRDLADAIVRADAGLIRSLTAEDLRSLLES